MNDYTLKYPPTAEPPVLNVSRDLDRFMRSMTDVTDRKQAQEGAGDSTAANLLCELSFISHNPRMSKDARLYKTLMVGARYGRGLESGEIGRMNEAFGRSKPRTDRRTREAGQLFGRTSTMTPRG
jgi:hypothetical protein